MPRRRSRHILLITLVAVVIALSVAWIMKATSGNNKNGTGPKSIIYGISDPDLINETAKIQTTQLSTMKSLGISSIRVDANWSWVQPNNPTTFHWARLDREVKAIRNAGMSADLIIDGCPPWAALPVAAKDPFPQPASPTEYANWAADVAQRYAVEGVNYFEIWNEPNIQRFWQPKPDPTAYTSDLIAAYGAIKKIDPSAFVISGGLAPATTENSNYNPISFLQAMYAHGAKGYFDAVGLHPYSFPASPDTYSPGSAWSQMDETIPSVRIIMIQHGDASKEVWITEFGAPTTGPFSVGQAGQNTEISQALADVRKMPWVRSFYIYTWRDVRGIPVIDQGFGLLGVLGLPKPAYYAVASALAKGNL